MPEVEIDEKAQESLSSKRLRERKNLQTHQWCEWKIYKGNLFKNKSQWRKNLTRSSPSSLRKLQRLYLNP
jgi:hypothetical protein